MSMGLSQVSASVRGLAFAMAQQGRVDSAQVLGTAATDALPAWALNPVRPSADADATREQVLHARGLDRIALMNLSPEARYRAEVSIDAETAARVRQAPVRASGTLVDIKV